MNHVLPILLLSAGISLHFMYCEWEFSNGRSQASYAKGDRTIYYQHNPRRLITPRDIVLRARKSSTREEARFYGVLLPVLLVGGTVMLLRRPS